jgi:hypothetical protein
LIDRYGICPANLNDLAPGAVCYQSVPKVKPTPDYPVCDRQSNGLCRVPGDGSARGEVETE